MTFDSDIADGLTEAITEAGTAATWLHDGAPSRSLNGIFNEQALAAEMRDAGFEPTYTATFVVDRAQVSAYGAARPAIGDTLQIDGQLYRVTDVISDASSYELRLRNG